MAELRCLRADHAQVVLDFEQQNRTYFAATISDRGDAYFARFAEGFDLLLAEQHSGVGAYYVLVAEDGSVIGRFNLWFTADHCAHLGYRVAQHVAGRGVATATVLELCGLARRQLGLHTLRAATSTQNAASRRVLTKASFVPTGPAEPIDLGGRTGTWYARTLDAA